MAGSAPSRQRWLSIDAASPGLPPQAHHSPRPPRPSAKPQRPGTRGITHDRIYSNAPPEKQASSRCSGANCTAGSANPFLPRLRARQFGFAVKKPPLRRLLRCRSIMQPVGHIAAFARGNKQSHSVVHPGDLEQGDLLLLRLEHGAVHGGAVAIKDVNVRHVARIAREQARPLRNVIRLARMRRCFVHGRFLRWHSEERTSDFNSDRTYISLNVELKVVFSCPSEERNAAVDFLRRKAAANDLVFEEE